MVLTSPELLLEIELKKEKPDLAVIEMLLALTCDDGVAAEDMVTESVRLGGVEVAAIDD